MSSFSTISERVRQRLLSTSESMTIEDYLHLCKDDPSVFATPHQRLLRAFGEPKIVETSKDPRLGRIFQNKKLNTWDNFSDFFGIETVIEDIYLHIKAAAQGMEEMRQILYLLGPVGSGKSQLASRLKQVFESEPFYTLRYYHRDGSYTDSPVNESPLWLFDYVHDADFLEEEYGIHRRHILPPTSPWALQRMQEHPDEGVQCFRVVKLYPSQLLQRAISKTEPADEATQDVSALVGSIDISQVGEFGQHHPDAYSYSGGLNRGCNGMMEFVEMFKASIRTLNPLLEATQSLHYKSTAGISALPWDGVIVSHSNITEWNQFRNDPKNEALVNRTHLIRVPYNLRVDEEVKIYQKMLRESQLHGKPCVKETLDILAEWAVLTRIKRPEHSTVYAKMRVYNGEVIKDTEPSAKSLIEYKEMAGVDEGMDAAGSTRDCFKVLSKTFNADPDEIAANPVHLMDILIDTIQKDSRDPEVTKQYKNYIYEYEQPRYLKSLEQQLQQAYLESYSDYGQNMFEHYFRYADAWIQNTDYRDPDTRVLWSRDQLNTECEKIEKPAGIANPKDFRDEIVRYVLRYQAQNSGSMPQWSSYTKVREVIEARIFSSVEEILPIISFGKKSSEEEERKHQGFIDRMVANGYTPKQVQTLVSWFIMTKKS